MNYLILLLQILYLYVLISIMYLPIQIVWSTCRLMKKSKYEIARPWIYVLLLIMAAYTLFIHPLDESIKVLQGIKQTWGDIHPTT